MRSSLQLKLLSRSPRSSWKYRANFSSQLEKSVSRRRLKQGRKPSRDEPISMNWKECKGFTHCWLLAWNSGCLAGLFSMGFGDDDAGLCVGCSSSVVFFFFCLWKKWLLSVGWNLLAPPTNTSNDAKLSCLD